MILVLLLPILLYLYFGCCLQSSAGQFALGRNHIKSTSPPLSACIETYLKEQSGITTHTHPPISFTQLVEELGTKGIENNDLKFTRLESVLFYQA